MCYETIGFINPYSVWPSFVYPVYSSMDSLYMLDINFECDVGTVEVLYRKIENSFLKSYLYIENNFYFDIYQKIRFAFQLDKTNIIYADYDSYFRPFICIMEGILYNTNNIAYMKAPIESIFKNIYSISTFDSSSLYSLCFKNKYLSLDIYDFICRFNKSLTGDIDLALTSLGVPQILIGYQYLRQHRTKRKALM